MEMLKFEGYATDICIQTKVRTGLEIVQQGSRQGAYET